MGSVKGTLTSWLFQGISARPIGQCFRPGVVGNKEGWKLLLLQGKSHLKLAKVQFWKRHRGSYFYLYLLGLGQSRMAAGMPSFLKSDHGRDLQDTLFSVWPSKWIGERGCSDFLFSPHLLGLAFSLRREGDARLVLSSYSTPTDLEPLAAVWEPKKGSGENDSKINQSGGEGRFSLKRKMNSPRIVQVKTMCRMHQAPWCSSNKEKWNDFPVHIVQPDWCVMCWHLAAIWWACVTTLGITLVF